MSANKLIGLAISVLVLLSPLTARSETAGDYAGAKIQLIVGFSAGGPSDIVARVVGAKLASILRADVVIENRVGASGNIASLAVAQAPPNGFTLLLTPSAFAINETIFPKRRFRFEEDFTAVALLAETSLVLVAHPSLKVRSFEGLRAHAATNNGAFYATAGQGTVTHLAGELFASLQGTKLIPVHYKGGGDLIRDVLSGQVGITFSTIPPVREQIASGNLIAIATTGLRRDLALPEVPTFIESGIQNYEVSLWLGLLAPRGTPPRMIDAMATASAEALTDSSVKEALRVQGFSPRFQAGAEFDAFLRSEISRWNALIERIGMPSVQ